MAKIEILLFCILGAIAVVTGASTDIQPPSGTQCSNIPPSLNHMRRGVDITKLDFTPEDPGANRGIKSPLFDFSCDFETKWTNPHTGVVHDRPDQIDDIVSISGGVINGNVEIFKSASDVMKSMTSSADVGLISGMFSSSSSYDSMKRTITNTSSFIEQVKAFHTAFRADLSPFWAIELGRHVKTFLQRRLPSTYESNPGRYQQFISYYGTHFFRSGKFGGLLLHRMTTDVSVYQKLGERQVKSDASGSFFNFLKANGAYSGTKKSVRSEFSSKTSTTTRYYGGHHGQTYNAWYTSVKTNPWLFAGQLAPIYDLIEDGNKKKALEKAITVHLDKAYLREVQKDVYTMLGRTSDAGFRRAIQAKLSEIVRLLRATVPNHNVVIGLGSQLKIPAWFTQNTKLCYRWYPDGDGGQCGGGVGRHLCAKVNQMTTYYRDDSDRRSGGCRMAWGIESSHRSSPWFNQVQVCFRWYPDGHGGQCGAGVARPRTLCAPVGRYTTFYRDDTDRRGGGCRMSWRITVPSSAPLWMRAASLCYEWYPDGDGGQCGGGAARRLCATANTWTAYYRDDTDRRSGGCRMRWGIVI